MRNNELVRAKRRMKPLVRVTLVAAMTAATGVGLMSPAAVAKPGGIQTEGRVVGSDKEVAMPTYITLIRYTDQGVKTFKELPQRLEETRAAGETLGAQLVAYYLTMGRSDAVVVSEAPNDETIARLALAAGGRGNVRTETLRAFTEDEATRIAAGLA